MALERRRTAEYGFGFEPEFKFTETSKRERSVSGRSRKGSVKDAVQKIRKGLKDLVFGKI